LVDLNEGDKERLYFLIARDNRGVVAHNKFIASVKEKKDVYFFFFFDMDNSIDEEAPVDVTFN